MFKTFKTPSFLEGAAGTLTKGVSAMQGTFGKQSAKLKQTITDTHKGIRQSVHEGTEALVGAKQSPALASTSADKIEQDSRDHIQEIQTNVSNRTRGIVPFSTKYNELVEKSGEILATKHLHHLAAANRAQKKGAELSSQIAKSTNPMGTQEQRDQGWQHDVAHLKHRLVAGLYNSALKTVVGEKNHQKYIDEAKELRTPERGGKRKHRRKTMKRKSNKRKHKKRHATKKRKHKKRHQTKKRKLKKKAHKNKAHKKKHRRTKKQRGGQCPCSGV